MLTRPATLDDIPALVRIHAQSWRETYAGLLPQDQIEQLTTPDLLTARWHAILSPDRGARVAMVDGGFAAMGPQRDEGLQQAGYPQELWAIYLLRCAQGKGWGRALMAAVASAPFTALVLEGNAPACQFYATSGGRVIAERPETIGDTAINELVYGWKSGWTGV